MYFIPGDFTERIAFIQELVGDHFIYYIGTEIPIDEGIKRFYENLDKHGQILIEEPDLIDYLEYDHILYLIIYKSLGKLEYLEYLDQKRVGKNHNK